jgi:hypothetical protein
MLFCLLCFRQLESSDTKGIVTVQERKDIQEILYWEEEEEEERQTEKEEEENE